MEPRKYPPSGRLFANDRRTNPKAPDITGKLEIDSATLDHLIECQRAGKPMEMEISAWRKKMQSGGDFLSLKARPPWKPDGALQGNSPPVNRRGSDSVARELDDDLEDIF